MDCKGYSVLKIIFPFLIVLFGYFLSIALNKKLGSKIKKTFGGIGAGIILSSSIWNLIIPAIEISETTDEIPWLWPALGVLSGFGIILLGEFFINKKNKQKNLAGIVSFYSIVQKAFLPFTFSFFGGILIIIVVKKIIPKLHFGEESKLGILGVCIGFVFVIIFNNVM